MAWVQDRDATLDDIARRADTHRATLHRHFGSRAELVEAAVRQCVADIAAVTADADVATGAPIDALRRVIAGYLTIGARIRFLFEDAALANHPAVAGLATDGDGPVLTLIRRAQTDGSVAGELPAAWIERAVWSLVYAASEAVDDGVLGRHEGLALLMRTVEHGISAGTPATSRSSGSGRPAAPSARRTAGR